MSEPISSTKNKALFYKDSSGKVWFFGIYSNNFEDRQGEIISWDAHLEYAQWIKESGYRPPIVLYHQPKMPDIIYLALYRAYEKGLITAQEYNEKINMIYKDFTIAYTKSIIPVNGFMLVIGEVPEDKYSAVTRMMGDDLEWGMSHGFLALKVNDNIIDSYRSFELTALASNRAANAYTVSLVIGEDGMADIKGLTEEDRQKIDEILPGAADKVEEQTQEAHEILSNLLASKQVDEPPVEEEKEEEETEPVEEKSITPLYNKIYAQVVKDLGIEELQQGWKTMVETVQAYRQEIDELKTKIKALEVSEDEKIASQYYSWIPPVTKKEESDTELLNKLKESAKSGIVAQNESPSDDKNPLTVGFWNFLAKG